MKKIYTNDLISTNALFILLLILGALTACTVGIDDEFEPDPKTENHSEDLPKKETTIVPRDSIALSFRDTTLSLADTCRLLFTYHSHSGKKPRITILNSDPEVIKYNLKTSTVKAIGTGTAVLLFRREDDSTIAAPCHFSVLDTAQTSKQQPVKVYIIEKDTTLIVGDTYSPNIKITPESIDPNALTWHSSHPKIAHVQNGIVTAVDSGFARVSVRLKDQSKDQDHVNIYVTKRREKQHIPVNGIELQDKSLTLYPNDQIDLPYHIYPHNATNRTVTWKSSNPQTVTTDQQGNITAHAAGKATITVTTSDAQKSDSCQITVFVPLRAITITPQEITLKPGQTSQLNAHCLPEHATDQQLHWSTSSPAICAVDQNGNVAAISPGKATITVKNLPTSIHATATVLVREEIKSIKLDKDRYILGIQDKSFSIKPSITVEPASAQPPKITFRATNPEFISVDPNTGTITVNPAQRLKFSNTQLPVKLLQTELIAECPELNLADTASVWVEPLIAEYNDIYVIDKRKTTKNRKLYIGEIGLDYILKAMPWGKPKKTWKATIKRTECYPGDQALDCLFITREREGQYPYKIVKQEPFNQEIRKIRIESEDHYYSYELRIKVK